MTAPRARSAAPPEALAERFRAELERLCSFWTDIGKIGLAVSGGPDSLGMLLLAEAAIPRQYVVATVNHGLRSEAADECAMVARLCAERGVLCSVLEVEVPAGNVQSLAREARYKALGRWATERALSAVATAHHADDQAETFFMRLNRGSGLAGLSGIREREWMFPWSIPIIRPLLTTTRAELSELVTGAGFKPVDDPSNADERFDRARIRRLLAQVDWLDAVQIARSASLLAAAQADIQQLALDEWESRVDELDEGFDYRPRCGARSVEIEIVSTVLERMGAKRPRSEIARMIDRLQDDGIANVGGVLATLVYGAVDEHRAAPQTWRFRREPPRRVGAGTA